MLRFVCGDIGGTNARFQLFQLDKQDPICGEVYDSQQEKSIISVLKKFIAKHVKDNKDWPVACCLACAGPVENNICKTTNFLWTDIDGSLISKQLNIKYVQIINDFAGIGFGLLALKPNELDCLNNAKPTKGGPKAVIGAGTGLGEAYLTLKVNSVDDDYDVWSSEGGHADFAPRNKLEFELLQHILDTATTEDKTDKTKKIPIDRVSVERVVSGLGMKNIYEFLSKKYPNLVIKEVEDKIREAIESNKENKVGEIVSSYARNDKNELCNKAIDLFMQLYGAEAGNLALKTLPTGGLYIVGNIANKNRYGLERNNQFYTHFLAKGRMKALLEKVPVYIVTHDNVGLLGASVVCRRLLRPLSASTGSAKSLPSKL